MSKYYNLTTTTGATKMIVVPHTAAFIQQLWLVQQTGPQLVQQQQAESREQRQGQCISVKKRLLCSKI